jgi:hypothetical protein
MILKRIDPFSAAKMLGLLYALLGHVVGAILAAVGLVAAAAGAGGHHPGEPGPIVLVLAVFVLPVVYGVIGFVVGLLVPALYNLAARLMGGIELTLEPSGSA